MASRRKRRILAVGAITAVVVGGLGIWWLQSPLGRGYSVIEEEVARLKKSGLPSTPDELRAASKAEGSNAAPLFRNAIAEVRGKSAMWFSRAFILRSAEMSGKTLSAAQEKELDDALKQLAPSFAQVELAVQRDRLDYGRRYEDSIYTLFPELAPHRGLLDLLAYDGYRAIRRGDLKTGRTRMLAAARGLRLLGDDPIFVAALVRATGEINVSRVMLYALQARPNDPEVVTLARDVLKAFGPSIDLRSPTAAESVIVHGLARQMAVRGPERFFLDMGLKAGDIDPYTIPLLRTHSIRLANEATMMRYWRIYRESLPADPTNIDAVQKAAETADTVTASQPVYSRLVLDRLAMFLSGAPETIGKSNVARRVLENAADAFEIRQRTGSFPKKLETLKDPFTNAPLHYVGLGDKMMLYSFGGDRKDDGGKLDGVLEGAKDFGVEIDLGKRKKAETKSKT